MQPVRICLRPTGERRTRGTMIPLLSGRQFGGGTIVELARDYPRRVPPPPKSGEFACQGKNVVNAGLPDRSGMKKSLLLLRRSHRGWNHLQPDVVNIGNLTCCDLHGATRESLPYHSLAKPSLLITDRLVTMLHSDVSAEAGSAEL